MQRRSQAERPGRPAAAELSSTQTTRKTTRLPERLAAALCLADLISNFDLKFQIAVGEFAEAQE